MYMLEHKPVAEFVGPFATEAEAYAYADKHWGELNSDEFAVWFLNAPLQSQSASSWADQQRLKGI